MNGKPLTANYGWPIRVIVPEVSGYRSVKWLDRITVQSEESRNLYQRYGYKLLPPEAIDRESASKYWDTTPALQDMPINSVITESQTGDTIKLSSSATIETKRYALPHGDQGPVVKVEVSTDDGRTWTEAEIMNGDKDRSKWSWALRKATIQIRKGVQQLILSRATDAGGIKTNGIGI